MHAGEIYIDAGATALDDVDGDITDKIVVTGSINPNVPGTYNITYNVKDKQGNEALSVTRKINVIDNVDPVITFNPVGDDVYTRSRSTVVTVRDPNSGVKESGLKYLWSTSISAPSESTFTKAFTNGEAIDTPSGETGDYYLWIYAEDNSGNQKIGRSNIFRLDNTPPVITMLGNSVVNVTGGATYSDTGVTASDDHSGLNGSVTSTSTVNTNKLGTYIVTYKVTDKAGNTATSSRTVNVVDNIFPTVTGVSVPTTWTSGNKTITVTGSDTGLSGIAGYYISTSSTKPTTASAWTASTSTTWTVSRGAGTYYIWIKDGAGNISSTYKSVTVTNIDANAPTVTAKGSSYTVTEATSNVISSTYFNISANGSAPISSTTCIDTSKSNAAVTNTSTLAVGTHVIKCTVTKATGFSSNAQTTIVVNPAYTGIPSGNYAVGSTVNFAGMAWKVMKDNGATTTLVASTIPYSYKIYQAITFMNQLNAWLDNNAILLQAKNDGGLQSMSFKVGNSSFNGYVRIPTYDEVNADYNGPKKWYSAADNYWTSTISGYKSDYYGGIRIYYVVSGSSITTQMETSKCSNSGCQYKTYQKGARPIITVREK